ERLENIARAVVEIEFAQPSEQEIAAVHKTFEEAEN
ncbi:MAG: ribosome maturation factor RimP, partial [Corynebacterium sp.]|nr:ribosome maturation factor RimP [Corynebacterium sp.]